jgi:hypothetical protein
MARSISILSQISPYQKRIFLQCPPVRRRVVSALTTITRSHHCRPMPLLYAHAPTPPPRFRSVRSKQGTGTRAEPNGGVGGAGARRSVVGAAGGGVGVPRVVGHARCRGRLHERRQPCCRRRVATTPAPAELQVGAHAGRLVRRRRGGGVPHGARADPHVQREGGEALRS